MKTIIYISYLLLVFLFGVFISDYYNTTETNQELNEEHRRIEKMYYYKGFIDGRQWKEEQVEYLSRRCEFFK